MGDKKIEEGMIEVVQHAEEAVTEKIGEVTQTLTDAAQTGGSFDIFGVPIWESGLAFLIVILIYNVVIHKTFFGIFSKKFKNRFAVGIYYGALSVVTLSAAHLFGLVFDVPPTSLMQMLSVAFMWICAKYTRRFLDVYFVTWSQNRFGKRAIAHSMLKDIAKRLIIVLSLLFTFIVFKIGIVQFFVMDIPGYVGVFVFLPLLVQMNLLSVFPVIKKGFVIGDYIKVGTGSDMVAGTCIAVGFSGVILEMPNGEYIPLQLSYVADAIVINLSTKHSHRSEMTYYIDVNTTDLLTHVLVVQKLISQSEECKLIQCNYISGTMYRHELYIVFDVLISEATEARAIMNQIHCEITNKLQEVLAQMPVLNEVEK